MDNPSVEADIWSLAVPSARRSLILCTLGAVIGLAIAGLGLFTAKGTRIASVPAEDIALVNGTPILMSDYIQQLRALTDKSLGEATPAERRKTLDDMIREELYVQRGIELGMQADTSEVRTALVGSVEAQTAADAIMAQPDEPEVRAFYQKHLADFASEGIMEVADYVLPRTATPQMIGAAMTALRNARNDEAAASRIARRSGTMRDGEEYYFAARIHLGDRLFDAARQIKPGEVSAPIAMPDGIHLLVMRKNIVPVPAPFEEVRDKVLSRYTDSQARILTAANESFLRKRADVQIAQGFQ